MQNTKIEWTQASWNPVEGCSDKSKGCDNCYARDIAARFSYPGGNYEGLAFRKNGRSYWTGKIRLRHDRLGLPLKWKEPRRIFVNSTSDLFHPGVPDDFIVDVFTVMAVAKQHTFQILTKRPDRMESLLSRMMGPRVIEFGKHAGSEVEGGPWMRAQMWLALIGRLGYVGANAQGGIQWPLPNVWLGTSTEDQDAADERVPHLLRTPAAVRFLSCEPLLGRVDLTSFLRFGREWYTGQPRLHWVIAGGESGPKARRAEWAWFESLKHQCEEAEVAFFMKQSGRELAKEGSPDKKGGDPAHWPPELRVRDFPKQVTA